MANRVLSIEITGTNTKAVKAIEGVSSAASKAGGAAEKSLGGASSRIGGAFSKLDQSLAGFGLPFAGALGAVGAKLESTEGKASSFGGTLGKIGGAEVLAAAAGLAVVGVGAVKAAGSFDTAHAALVTATAGIGQSFDAVSGKVSGADDKLVKLGFSTTQTETALGVLTTASHSSTKALSDIGLAADIARGRHMDLASATSLLAKVETGHVALLGRVGIATKDASGKTISQEEAIKRLTALYGGQASAYAQTFDGKLATLSATSNKLAVDIGGALIPQVEHLASGGLAVVGGLEAANRATDGWLGKLALAGAAIPAVVFAGGKLVDGAKAIGGAYQTAGQGVRTIIGAFGSASAAEGAAAASMSASSQVQTVALAKVTVAQETLDASAAQSAAAQEAYASATAAGSTASAAEIVAADHARIGSAAEVVAAQKTLATETATAASAEAAATGIAGNAAVAKAVALAKVGVAQTNEAAASAKSVAANSALAASFYDVGASESEIAVAGGAAAAAQDKLAEASARTAVAQANVAAISDTEAASVAAAAATQNSAAMSAAISADVAAAAQNGVGMAAAQAGQGANAAALGVDTLAGAEAGAAVGADGLLAGLLPLAATAAVVVAPFAALAGVMALAWGDDHSKEIKADAQALVTVASSAGDAKSQVAGLNTAAEQAHNALAGLIVPGGLGIKDRLDVGTKAADDLQHYSDVLLSGADAHALNAAKGAMNLDVERQLAASYIGSGAAAKASAADLNVLKSQNGEYNTVVSITEANLGSATKAMDGLVKKYGEAGVVTMEATSAEQAYGNLLAQGQGAKSAAQYQSDLAGAHDRVVTAVGKNVAIQDKVSAAEQQGTDATHGLTAAQTDAATATKAQTDALTALDDKLKHLNDDTLAAANSDIAAKQAVIAVGDAAQTVTDKYIALSKAKNDGGQASRDFQSAQLAENSSILTVASSAEAAAKSHYDLTNVLGPNATATQKAAFAVGEETAKHAAAKQQLDILAATYPALSGKIHDYEVQLGLIPKTVTTTPKVDSSGAYADAAAYTAAVNAMHPTIHTTIDVPSVIISAQVAAGGKIQGIPVGGSQFTFGDGGYVPGPKDQAVSATVHAGEFVVSNKMQDKARAAGTPFDPSTLTTTPKVGVSAAQNVPAAEENAKHAASAGTLKPTYPALQIKIDKGHVVVVKGIGPEVFAAKAAGTIIPNDGNAHKVAQKISDGQLGLDQPEVAGTRALGGPVDQNGPELFVAKQVVQDAGRDTAVRTGGNRSAFADGGYVPGPKGTAVPAIVHAGEFVVSNKMQDDAKTASRPLTGAGLSSTSPNAPSTSNVAAAHAVSVTFTPGSGNKSSSTPTSTGLTAAQQAAQDAAQAAQQFAQTATSALPSAATAVSQFQTDYTNSMTDAAAATVEARKAAEDYAKVQGVFFAAQKKTNEELKKYDKAANTAFQWSKKTNADLAKFVEDKKHGKDLTADLKTLAADYGAKAKADKVKAEDQKMLAADRKAQDSATQAIQPAHLKAEQTKNAETLAKADLAAASDPANFTKAVLAETSLVKLFEGNLKVLVGEKDTTLAKVLETQGPDEAGMLAAGFAASKPKADAAEKALDAQDKTNADYTKFVTTNFKASGGPVSSGTAYVVGEKGPEVFLPKSAGQIIPHGKSISPILNHGSRSQGGVINLTIHTSVEPITGRVLYKAVLDDQNLNGPWKIKITA